MKKTRGSRWWLIMICCILAVPTVGQLMGLYGADMTIEAMRPALMHKIFKHM